MNIDTVRFVDKYIGIPICLALSLLRKIATLFQRILPPKTLQPPRKILLIELSEMGSTVIAYSAIMRLKETFPAAEFSFLIFQKNKESVELLGVIPPQNILVIRDDNLVHFLQDTARYLFTAWKTHFDAVVDLELFSRFTTILSFMSWIPRRVGFYKYTHEGLYRGNLLTHNVYYNPHVHMVHNFLALSDALCLDERFYVREKTEPYAVCLPHFDLDQKLIAHFKKMIGTGRPILVLNPYPGKLLPIRNWGRESFAQVAQYAISKEKACVVIVGLPSGKEDADFIMNFCKNNNNIIDLTGKTKNIYELIHILSLAQVFLTNDSGPAHFAALVPIHNLVIFGPETPALYNPLSEKTVAIYTPFTCSPCLTAMNHRKTLCTNNLCLQSITVDGVCSLIGPRLRA